MIKIKNILLIFLLSMLNVCVYAQEREEILRVIPSMNSASRTPQKELNATARAPQKELNSPRDRSFDAIEDETNSTQEKKATSAQKESASSSYSYLWFSLFFGLSFVMVLGLGRFLFVRLLRRPNSSDSAYNLNKLMNVVSSLDLTPKRKILLVRVREKEMVLASTETGISLLCDGSKAQMLPSFQLPSEVEKVKKPDVLLKALKSIEGESSKENKVPFSQYLASAFEKEGKKGVSENMEVHSATALIREKLKTMRPLS